LRSTPKTCLVPDRRVFPHTKLRSRPLLSGRRITDEDIVCPNSLPRLREICASSSIALVRKSVNRSPVAPTLSPTRLLFASVRSIAKEIDRSLCENIGTACLGTMPARSCSPVMSFKYDLTILAAAGLSSERPISWKADRNLPIMESTDPNANLVGQPHPKSAEPEAGFRGHVIECTTVFPVASAAIRKLTTSSAAQDSTVGLPGSERKNLVIRTHVAHLERWYGVANLADRSSCFLAAMTPAMIEPGDGPVTRWCRRVPPVRTLRTDTACVHRTEGSTVNARTRTNVGEVEAGVPPRLPPTRVVTTTHVSSKLAQFCMNMSRQFDKL